MRMAASCCHPLQVMELPRGARMEVGAWISVSTGMSRCYLLANRADKQLGYHISFFLYPEPKISVFSGLRVSGMVVPRQNLDSEDVRGKILQTKELSADVGLFGQNIVCAHIRSVSHFAISQ